MARQNYSYEKRQREIAKKKKQEAKRKRREGHQTEETPAEEQKPSE